MTDPPRLLQTTNDPTLRAALQAARAEHVSAATHAKALAAATAAGQASAGVGAAASASAMALKTKVLIGVLAIAGAAATTKGVMALRARSPRTIAAMPTIETPASASTSTTAHTPEPAPTLPSAHPPAPDTLELIEPALALAPPPSKPAAASTSARAIVAPPSSSIATQEFLLLDRARQKLRASDAPGALALLDEHDADYPSPLLAEESAALRVDALMAQGTRKAAITRAKAYLARWPKGAYASRMHAVADAEE